MHMAKKVSSYVVAGSDRLTFKFEHQKIITNCPTMQVGTRQVEDVLLSSAVIVVDGLDLEDKLFDERAPVNCLRVRVGIPRLLLDDERRFRKNSPEPPYFVT